MAEPKPNAKIEVVFAENFKEVGFLKTTLTLIVNLPSIVLVSLINHFGLKKKIKGNRQRFSEGGLLDKLRENGLKVVENLPAYAEQDLVIVAEKD